MSKSEQSERPEHLRVLIANERKERLELTMGIVAALGHEVVARSLDVSQVAAITAEATPDVALVGLGEEPHHALELITRIVQEAACPVILLLQSDNPNFVNEAAKRGIFAYISHDQPEELQSALDIVLRRFTEFKNLEGAFGRRAVTERAKGILMERHALDEQQAFEMLRSNSRRTGRKLVDIAAAVVDSHLVRPAQAPGSDGQPSDAAVDRTSLD